MALRASTSRCFLKTRCAPINANQARSEPHLNPDDAPPHPTPQAIGSPRACFSWIMPVDQLFGAFSYASHFTTG
jgi:hypothetical protein